MTISYSTHDFLNDIIVQKVERIIEQLLMFIIIYGGEIQYSFSIGRKNICIKISRLDGIIYSINVNDEVVQKRINDLIQEKIIHIKRTLQE